ncbi:MAG: Threonine efflux protein [Chlamydiales bacterium]|nr:Threonine efflux protein [Chlamydiales bacterium]MCH9620075.1 Threonine efflux protein [Chlamydiales bacterium]MCH9623506.1 Threonine efflux protein [Chlamydiales bacterium]
MSTFLAIASLSFLIAVSPGPDFVVVVKNSLSYSRKKGFLTGLGVSLALLVHLAYTILGVGYLISKGNMLYFFLKYAGAGYLFYLGCKGLISSFKGQKSLLESCIDQNTLSAAGAFRQGFLTNLLNPKCALFFMSFFSQFILASTSTSLKIGYACINWLVTLGWFLLLSYLITGKYITSRIASFHKYIDRIMGCALILLSLYVLFRQ